MKFPIKYMGQIEVIVSEAVTQYGKTSTVGKQCQLILVSTENEVILPDLNGCINALKEMSSQFVAMKRDEKEQRRLVSTYFAK